MTGTFELVSTTVFVACVLCVAGCDDATDEESPATQTGATVGPTASGDPAAVAEAYLRAGSAQNAEQVLANLDPSCASDEAMTRVDSVRVMGAPIEIDELSVTVQSRDDDGATVRYEVSGSAHGEGGTTTLLGAEVTTGEVNVDDARQSGTLTLRRIDGAWRVACP